MRRILAVLMMTALLLVALAVPAFAKGEGPSACKEQQPGQYISTGAQEQGHSDELNPGNAQNEYPPFVPFAQNNPCNPNAA